MVLVLTGQVWVAPVGTPGPTSVSSALHSAFKDMGFISEEGVKFTEDRQVEARFSWTSLYPKELVIVGRTATVEFALREFNKRAVEFALEGSVTSNGAEWKHDAFNAAAVSKALVIDAADGSSLVRLYFPSGVVEADVESGHSRAGSTDLPVAFSSDRATTDPYTLWRTGVK
jgi:hypothetical protein